MAKVTKEVNERVKKQSLKKKTSKKPLPQTLQMQIKTNGKKWLETENECNWVTFKDIKKETEASPMIANKLDEV